MHSFIITLPNNIAFREPFTDYNFSNTQSNKFKSLKVSEITKSIVIQLSEFTQAVAQELYFKDIS